MSFTITFWGVRGSIACPFASHMHYGGNTSCVEVCVGGECIILDAGTGIRLLGRRLSARGVQEVHLLLSHTHFDHINGLPFYLPSLSETVRLRLITGHLKGNNYGYPRLQTLLAQHMARPFFPVPLECIKAQIIFEEYSALESETFFLGTVKVETGLLHHIDGATGYRIEYQGKSMAYITDTEHVPGLTDENVLRLMDNADVVIYDSTYTDEEFLQHRGWGHSTWREGVRLARIAHVKRLFLFHHHPDYDDPMMSTIEKEAQSLWDGVVAAREGMTYHIE